MTVLTLMKNAKINDAELMEVLNLGTSNSAAYYRKELEKEGIIKGYRAEIDWKKLGCSVQFIIIAEGENLESLLEMEEAKTLSIKKYNESFVDICFIPTISGGIILEDMSFCFGNRAIAIIKGRATSEHDVVVYSKHQLIDPHPGTKTTIAIIKNNIIENFIIDKESLNKLIPPSVYDKVEESEKLVKPIEDFFK